MSLDDVQLDVLDSGREPDRRRRAAAAVLAAVLVVALLAGLYVDHRSRQHEFAAVSRCTEEAGSAYRVSTSRLSAMAEYIRPSLVYAGEPTAQGLYGMVAHEAEGAGNSLVATRDRCASITVRRWHSSQRKALSTQLAVQDVELAFLDRVAASGDAYYADQDQLAKARSAAATALARARPGLLG